MKGISNKLKINFMLLFLLSSVPVLTQAATVFFQTGNVTGNTWETRYTVVNDTPGFELEEFSVFFDLDLYENIVATATPTGWDSLVIQPDPFLPDDGFYDALALGPGIASGDRLSGFSVQFDFLGTGPPGPQSFTVVDPLTFSTLEQNLTTVVPLPAGVGLFIGGLLFLFGVARGKAAIS